ncbi:MAG: hypothetical protein EOP54_05530 [Sphingobacteriales bacterium]|nr:MAG: hypothetical protein EOP54_05530 [Sphingobacteriales bacterium]
MLALSALLCLGISSISCKKNDKKSSSKYVGIATTYKSEIRSENDSEYHFMAYDTLDFELTVTIEGKNIQFLSTNDSIIESRTFKITDSAFNNNTYTLIPRTFTDPDRAERMYRMKEDSLIYSYSYQMPGTINSYSVKFAGIKQ